MWVRVIENSAPKSAKHSYIDYETISTFQYLSFTLEKGNEIPGCLAVVWYLQVKDKKFKSK